MVAFLAGSLAPVSRTGLVLIKLDMTAWLTGVPCTIEGALLKVIFVFTLCELLAASLLLLLLVDDTGLKLSELALLLAVVELAVAFRLMGIVFLVMLFSLRLKMEAMEAAGEFEFELDVLEAGLIKNEN